MADIVSWPRDLLVPKECRANIAPFTRSGGRSLGGVKRSVRTDLGFWSIELNGVILDTSARQRTFEAIKDILSGSSGRIAVPIYAFKKAPYLSGRYEAVIETLHDDDTSFDDGTPYVQGAISVVSDGLTPVGATTIRLRVINASDDLSGVIFSYNHALYRTGQILDQDGSIYTMKISPTVREAIPDGADLEFDQPTCLCNLTDDNGMTSGENIEGYELISASFTEDTDYWNQLALGLI